MKYKQPPNDEQRTIDVLVAALREIADDCPIAKHADIARNALADALVANKQPPNAPKGQKFVCDRCGSSEVYNDAWVGANDTTDILGPYDNAFCAKCDGECSYIAAPLQTPEPERNEDGEWPEGDA